MRLPQDVPERLRRRVITMSSQAGSVASKVNEDDASVLEESDVDFLFRFNDAVALCLVVDWSWVDFPVSQDGLLDLPGVAYDALIKYSQSKVKDLLPNFSVDADPKALTESFNV